MAAATRRSSGALMIAGILLVAANLRPVLTSVGPLLDQIGAETGLGAPALGLLAAVPLLAFALVSPLAQSLSERFGVERTVFAALLVLICGTLLRPLPGSVAYLWVGTFIIGASIAVCNVLLPALLKRDFPEKVAKLTGAYSAVIGGVASLGAGLSVPLSMIRLPDGSQAGWRLALGAYVLLAIPAVLLWLPQLRRKSPDSDVARQLAAVPAPARGAVWKSAVAWQVTIYMGLQSLTFFSLVTWLPTLERSYGRSDVASGWDLMLFQLIGVVASLLTPLMLRGEEQRIGAAFPPALLVVAVLGVMFFPPLMLLWVLLSGLSSGSSLVVALALFGLRTGNHRQAGALSGMAQSIGYLLAAAGPPLFGALFAVAGGWPLPLAFLALAASAQIAVGSLVGRNRNAFAR
ncbi:CynX/NimT family MFS transporter [Paeniglutamicibacter cryotolerans]|uniref:CP family cyanate transporter-like MFS transporter n=1 Tax=Paeniglutamicibacter cryotolerans TaxID=670079 RepID=A0A839QNA8_9MICC|nr:MFS transporter [Paeniglutamicibacter cryotolerans]MBB2994702.1 CP family cyanate transporter-like MFS transporter [Paeniglutamicibacter cryotolerans]